MPAPTGESERVVTVTPLASKCCTSRATSGSVAVPSAVIGAIIGEFISSQRGVGYLVASASSQYNTAGVFAGIFALLVVVAILDLLVAGVETYFMRWRPKVSVGREQV